MSLLGLFDIGRSALFAARTGIYVTGHNIANVNTPGYNRQEVILQTKRTVQTGAGMIGRGVDVSHVRRRFDLFTYNQLLLETQQKGRYDEISNLFSEIEQIFNESEESGLYPSLKAFANAWHEVATNPESIPQRIVLLKEADSFLLTAKKMERRLLDSLKNAEETVESMVEEVNSILQEIAHLNDRIVQTEAGVLRGEANDLRDQRERALLKLSELVDVSYFEDNDGAIKVFIGMKNVVDKARAKTLSVKYNVDGLEGIYIGNEDISGRLKGGRIEGILSASQDIQNELLTGLRRLVASVIKEVNYLHRMGYGLDAGTGRDFFNPLTLYVQDNSTGADLSATILDPSMLTLDEYRITFDATNYYIYNIQQDTLVASGVYIPGNSVVFDGIQVVITGTVTASDSFIVSPLTGILRDAAVAISDPREVAAASSDTALPADNSNALAIADLFDRPIGTLQNASYFDYYNGLITSVGVKSRFASDSVKFEETLIKDIQNRRESISGVSLDEEALNLIKYQRAFEAGARLIKVTDEILQTLINL